MNLSHRVNGYGANNAKILIVGIAPGADETRIGIPFIGPSGGLLREDLHEAGINIDECYRTNIFKHQLPNNEFRRYEELGLSLKEAILENNEKIVKEM